MIYRLLRPLVFCLPAEFSHNLGLKLLQYLWRPCLAKRVINTLPQKPVSCCGLTFPNAIGLAAGLDKNGDAIDALLGLGFGFVEVGTVTPRPQPGNPKPRLFRTPKARALINRMGFNNKGVDYLVENLKKRRMPGLVGANIGKNKETPLEQAADDYLQCFHKVYPHVDYITVNISSPNTPGLRQLQGGKYLQSLLDQLTQARATLIQAGEIYKPLFVKIAPDLTDQELAETADTLLNSQVDAVIATNTTIDHSRVNDLPYGKEQGGLSGAPLMEQATCIVEKLRSLVNDKLPIIAVGGILSTADVERKLTVGAQLVQVYTGLIYQGPGWVRHIVKNIK